MKSLTTIAHNIKVQAHATWLCAHDPDVPWGPKLLALAIAAYALSPIDLIPDFIPVIGLLDEALLIPVGIWVFRKTIAPEIFARHLIAAEESSQRPVSKIGALAILCLWVALAVSLWALFGN